MAENRCYLIDWDETFWRMIQKGAEMRRDDDYLRELLFKLEADEGWNYIFSPDTEEEEREYYHLMLLADADLLERSGTFGEMWRITNAGHDFIALTRRNEAWEKVKGAGARIGGASVQILYRIAEGYARQKLTELGIPLA